MERLVEYSNDVTSRYHRARYEFAKKYCEGKTVVDVACGGGFGTRIIAEVAEHVIGIDPFIEKGGDNITMNGYVETMQASLCDVMVSMETIEHTISIDLTLQMYSLALNVGGLLVLSFPNGWGETEYHLHDTDKKLVQLVGKYFMVREIYGQSRRSNVEPVEINISEIDDYENIILIADKKTGVVNDLSYDERFSFIYAECLRRQKEKTKGFGFKLKVLPARLRTKMKRVFAK